MIRPCKDPEWMHFDAAGRLYDDAGLHPLWFAQPGDGARGDAARLERKLPRIAEAAVGMAGDHHWITDRFSHVYYHWMADALPRLEALAQARSGGSLIVPPRVLEQAFAVESLRAYAGFEIADLPEGESFRARIAVAPRAAVTPQVDAQMVRAVSHRLRAHFECDPNVGNRLHVTRRVARHRRLANEAQAEPVLGRHGFEVREMEWLSLAEQARLAASADILCGPHGAGLANMIFMEPGSTVVELRQREGSPPCYDNLAAALGLRHIVVECKSADPQTHPHAADINVDPLHLEAVLGELSG